MTYPITLVCDLRHTLEDLPALTPLSVRDNHGNQLELAGVEDQRDDQGVVVGFVLVVAQKEQKP